MSTTTEEPVSLEQLKLTEVETETDQNSTRSPEKVTPIQVESSRCVLEDYTQCSKSHLWKLMMSYYDRKGISAWSSCVVPNFITCNSFIGKCYAKVLHGFLADAMKPDAVMPVDVNEPLYIVELGVGSGKFSFLMLQALEEMQKVCDFPLRKIVYVMTDFTEANFKFWIDHPNLKKYFDNGLLDAGIFDATNDSTIKLYKSGIELGPNTIKNPMCVVANYLFDTLYHDIFQVDGLGDLYEGLVSTGSQKHEEVDPLEPDIILRLDNRYNYRRIVDVDRYYTDEEGDEVHLARILRWYTDFYKYMNESNNNSGASVLLPIGALRAIRRLAKMANNRLIVISGDKGNNNPEQFCGMVDPHIAIHGSFSLMVNYHAIGTYFTSRGGGFSLHNYQDEASLKVSCFILPGDGVNINEDKTLYTTKAEDLYRNNLDIIDTARAKQFPYLSQAFTDVVSSFGPNDFFMIQKGIKEDISNPPLRTVLALLKLSDWDTDVFFKFRDQILNQLPNNGIKLKNDLCRGIPRLWKHYFVLDTEKDIAFEIGRVYYGIREFKLALEYYQISTATIGKHQVTYHNQGLCFYSLGDLPNALVNFETAVQMSEHYEKARNWAEKVKKELAQKAEAENAAVTHANGRNGSSGSGRSVENDPNTNPNPNSCFEFELSSEEDTAAVTPLKSVAATDTHISGV